MPHSGLTDAQVAAKKRMQLAAEIHRETGLPMTECVKQAAAQMKSGHSSSSQQSANGWNIVS